MAVFKEMATSVKTSLSDSITVAVPTIADAEIDAVTVEVTGLDFSLVVGDAVIAIPLAALPTSCEIAGARVVDANDVRVSFGALEGGSGVTGANVAFRFLCFDTTP
jgi:hypothetical protein